MPSVASSCAAVGFVTSADDAYLYVWSKALNQGAKELRFKKSSNADIKVGTWVHFDLSGLASADGVQTGGLQPADWLEPITTIVRMNRPGGCVWRASCVVTFSPPNYAAYVQAKASYAGLLGLAYSVLFGHIALLEGKLQYEVGKVYQLRIKRLDRAQDDVAQAVGTLFCVSVSGSVLDVVRELRDEGVCNEVLEKAPWPREDLAENPGTSKDTEARRSTHAGPTLASGLNNNDGSKDSKVRRTRSWTLHRVRILQKDQTSDAYSRLTTSSTTTNSVQVDAEQDGSRGPLYEGVIYEVEPSRAYIYVSSLRKTAVAFTTDAVQPPVGTLLKFRLKNSLRYFGSPLADAPEEVGVLDNEQLLDVYKESAFPFQEDHRGLDVQAGIKEYAELLQLQHGM